MNQKPSLILASASPRRQQMLALSKIPFDVIVSNSDELPLPGEPGADYVLRNAQQKAYAVAKKLDNDRYILSADTIVLTQSGLILEKPRDALHAHEMLQNLSGDFHLVLTGYSLFHGLNEIISRRVETKVYFKPLSLEEIQAYVALGESFDKAGGYAIQGAAMIFVERIEGSYTNVMGLPLTSVLQDLKEYCGILPLAQ